MWLHAVTRQLPADRLVGLTGAGGAPVEVVRIGDDLDAVVAPVDLDEYGEAALHRNLGDLRWLEAAASVHHRVIEAVWRFGPTLPARLATVYQDGPALRAGLHDRQAEFGAALDRLTDRAEWGVKAYSVRAAEAPGAASVQPSGGGGAGAEYLRRRRTALAAGEAARRAAAEGAEAVHAALSGQAEAARRHRPQDRSLSGVPDPMVLNGAYLLPAGRAADFAELVRELGTRHPVLRLELTGPWPPYSFAALDDTATHGSATHGTATLDGSADGALR
ncbi:gas vesicle protein GvpFL [Plantactinospora sp. BC1]|nr:gas vesicle protein GvpFL [Plantactinospora sp. BC1]